MVHGLEAPEADTAADSRDQHALEGRPHDRHDEAECHSPPDDRPRAFAHRIFCIEDISAHGSAPKPRPQQSFFMGVDDKITGPLHGAQVRGPSPVPGSLPATRGRRESSRKDSRICFAENGEYFTNFPAS